MNNNPIHNSIIELSANSYKLEKIKRIKEIFSLKIESDNLVLSCFPELFDEFKQLFGDVIPVYASIVHREGEFMFFDKSPITIPDTKINLSQSEFFVFDSYKTQTPSN